MLSLQNISKTFPTLQQPVLEDINLHIKAGEYCVVVGSNGSGKSTLFKVISGEYECDSGRITIDNADATSASFSSRAKYIASVVQDISKGTVGDLTVMENLVLSNMKSRDARLNFYELSSGNIAQQIKSLELGLESLINQKMSSLSGGQRQSIATLMATHPLPKLLLLDEHTSALDPKTRHIIMEFTDRVIKQNRITTMMITHNIQDALKYGNRLLIMSNGKIICNFDSKAKSNLSEDKILDILHQAGEGL